QRAAGRLAATASIPGVEPAILGAGIHYAVRHGGPADRSAGASAAVRRPSPPQIAVAQIDGMDAVIAHPDIADAVGDGERGGDVGTGGTRPVAPDWVTHGRGIAAVRVVRATPVKDEAGRHPERRPL